GLLEADDGGLYRLPAPGAPGSGWVTLDGTLRNNEMTNIAYDPLSDLVLGGAQDNGTPQQNVFNSQNFAAVTDGGGGVARVDATSGPGFSIRYSSSQQLRSFTRAIYDSANNLVDRKV